MNLKAFLFEEDRGVSPVIGVILMVAITVILAAVIATFVMNMGPGEATQPNSDWDTSAYEDGSTNYTEIAHTGGDAADPSEFVVTGNGERVDLEDGFSGDEMTAGDSSVIKVDSGNFSTADLDSVDEFTLIWENPNNDQTQEVTSWSP